jgi:hypothetical protein
MNGTEKSARTAQMTRRNFAVHSVANIAIRLDLHNGPVRAYSLFAHCCACSMDLPADREIVAELARVGIRCCVSTSLDLIQRGRVLVDQLLAKCG